MLPFWFSAMTMKSVGKAALAMVEEVRRQFNTINGLMEGTARPDYSRCVKISTDSSLKEMIPPGECNGGTSMHAALQWTLLCKSHRTSAWLCVVSTPLLCVHQH